MNALATNRRKLRCTRLAGVCLLMACAIVSAVIPRIASAQATQRGETAEGTLDVEQLRSRAAALRAELERERKRAADGKTRSAEELKELQQARSAAADRLLTLEIERERNADKLKSLQAGSGQVAEEAKLLASEADAVVDAAREAAEQLRLHLREVPASDAATEELRAIAAALTSPGKDVTPEKREQQAAAIETLLAKCDAAHAAASKVQLATASIYTASGEREEVKLLSLGHVRFAYETIKDHRVGIALSSMQDAAGFRWTEDLPGGTQAAIHEAIATCERSDAHLISVPIDPTGRVKVEEVNAQQSVYGWFVAGGMVMIPLVAVAVLAIAVVIERVVVLYAANPNSDAVAAAVVTAARAGNFDQALSLAMQKRGAVGRVLAACLGRRLLGQRAMEDAIQEQLLQELPRLQRFMGSLATLAGIAPLLGLLGTVTGIIQTFSVIRSFGNANPALMAGGISEALITTALGLMIAVPVVICHSIFRGRSDRILADAERNGASLLTSLVHRPQISSTRGIAEPVLTEIADHPRDKVRGQRVSDAQLAKQSLTVQVKEVSVD